jgi:hypothetical protein
MGRRRHPTSPPDARAYSFASRRDKRRPRRLTGRQRQSLALAASLSCRCRFILLRSDI